MTREEAITNYIVPAIKRTWNDKKCKEILEALEQEPKTEKVFKMRNATPEEQKSTDDYIESISKPTGVDFLDSEQEPKIGHWIIYDVHGHKACKCSECDKDVGYPCNYKYCPYCGYRMLKPQESEEESKTEACKNCKWRKDRDEVFRRGVSMEDLCAACHIRSNRK